MKESRFQGARQRRCSRSSRPGAGRRPVLASSHREAPAISNDPVADNTDVYFFRDPVDPVAARHDRQLDPAGGAGRRPQLLPLRARTSATSSTSTPTATPSRTWSTASSSRATSATAATFLQNTGAVTSLDDPDQNVVLHLLGQEVPRSLARPERMHRHRQRSDRSAQQRRPQVVSERIRKRFGAVADSVYPIDENTIIFAGPRAEGFYVDLGMIFDLINFRPDTLSGDHGGGVNATAGYNVHAIAISVPIQNLTANDTAPTDAADPNAIVSMWSSTWRRQNIDPELRRHFGRHAAPGSRSRASATRSSTRS